MSPGDCGGQGKDGQRGASPQGAHGEASRFTLWALVCVRRLTPFRHVKSYYVEKPILSMGQGEIVDPRLKKRGLSKRFSGDFMLFEN